MEASVDPLSQGSRLDADHMLSLAPPVACRPLMANIVRVYSFLTMCPQPPEVLGHDLSQRPRLPVPRGDSDLPLPKPMRSATLAAEPPVSGKHPGNLANVGVKGATLASDLPGMWRIS